MKNEMKNSRGIHLIEIRGTLPKEESVEPYKFPYKTNSTNVSQLIHL